MAFPGQGLNVDMASMTTLYAEAIGEGGSGPWAGGLMAVYNGPHSGWAQFVGTGSVADASWAYIGFGGVSLSFADAQPGDPDATVAVDPPSSSDGSSPGPQFTPLYLNLPAGLPNGTTVKISIDPAIAGLIKVYADNNGVPVAGVLFGDGLASYTWTVGSNNPPSVLDVESLADFAANANAFAMAVQPPAGRHDRAGGQHNPAGGQYDSAGDSPPGLLVAFDGTQDEGAGTDTNIFQFSQAYVAAAHTSILRKARQRRHLKKTARPRSGGCCTVLPRRSRSVNTAEGVNQMFSIVADALIRIQEF